MVRSTERLILFLLFVSCTFVPLYAMDWAITGGPISFFPLSDNQSVPDGLYGEVGARFGITPRIELELGIVTQLTPVITETIGASAVLGLDLLGDIEPTYFNMIADLGMIYLIERDTGEHHPMISLRISPIAIGNPFYGERGRLFTTGLLYDLSKHSFTMTFSMVIENWFLSRWD